MSTKDKKYHPEPYWSEVAERINERGEKNFLAGDDSPFYRYKRKKFLALLNSLPFTEKDVLEIGHGPGGNLYEVLQHNPKSLSGVDISNAMIKLAKNNLGEDNIDFNKIDGTSLPFEDQKFDYVFSATVLQHNSDENMMKSLLQEMCRVSSHQVVLFERIENKLKGDDLCVGRPVEYYAAICKEKGFELTDTKFINIQASYLVSGAIRKLLNSAKRKEGQQLSKIAELAQQISLPVTSIIDKIYTPKRDLAKVVLTRKQ